MRRLKFVEGEPFAVPVRAVDFGGRTWEIASAVTVPPIRREPSGWSREEFPFELLEVGECFDVFPDEGDKLDVERCQNRVSRASCRYREQADYECNFTTRQIHSGNVAFARCWRIA